MGMYCKGKAYEAKTHGSISRFANREERSRMLALYHHTLGQYKGWVRHKVMAGLLRVKLQCY